MGFDLAVGPYAEHSRVVHRLSSGLGTWSIRSGTSQTLSAMDLTVCSQPLTFDEATHQKNAGRTITNQKEDPEFADVAVFGGEGPEALIEAIQSA